MKGQKETVGTSGIPVRHFKPAALGAALAALLGVLVLAWLFSRPMEDSRDVVALEPASSQSPMHSPVAIAATASSPPLASPPASLEGLVLHGVIGGGTDGGAAIISISGGPQRSVRLGRELLPDLRVTEVGLFYAVLTGTSGDFRMELNRFGGPAQSTAASPNPIGGLGKERDEAKWRETIDYRLGLAPRKKEGRTTGFTIRPDAKLPILARAGLQPGDVIVSVNGQAFQSDEKVLELYDEIAGSYTAEFEFERGSKRMKASLEVNRKPGS